MKTFVAVLIAASFCSFDARAQTVAPPSPSPAVETYPPVPAKYFNDYAGITSQAAQDQLNQELVDFDARTSTQVVVAIFKRKESSTPLEDYCARVSNKWGVGRKGKNNGVVLFVFMDDHLLRITTGWAMSTELPDTECKKIIDQVITPGLRTHDYDGALTAGVDAILKTIRDNSPEAEPQGLQ